MPERELSEVLARQLDEQLEQLERLLALVPREQMDFAPAYPAFRLGELVAHLEDAVGGVCACLDRVQQGRGGRFSAAAAPGVSEARKLCREAWLEMNDEQLHQRIVSLFQPEGSLFLEIYLTNMKHLQLHTYQLFVYLKSLQVPLDTRDLYRMPDAGA